MPNIRKSGLEYLKQVIGNIPSDPIAVSKFYEAKQSWTRKPTWWFDLSIKKLKNNSKGFYYLVGKAKKSNFIILKVPCAFFIKNINDFETRYQDKIRLHITAEGENRFVDERGPNGSDFTNFVLKLKKKQNRSKAGKT